MIVSPVFLFEPCPVALHVEERGLQKRTPFMFNVTKHLVYFIEASRWHLSLQMGKMSLRVPVRCTIHWGVYYCPAKKIACRPSGGPLKEIGVSLRTSPASSDKDGQRVPAVFTEPEYPTRRNG